MKCIILRNVAYFCKNANVIRSRGYIFIYSGKLKFWVLSICSSSKMSTWRAGLNFWNLPQHSFSHSGDCHHTSNPPIILRHYPQGCMYQNAFSILKADFRKVLLEGMAYMVLKPSKWPLYRNQRVGSNWNWKTLCWMIHVQSIELPARFSPRSH